MQGTMVSMKALEADRGTLNYRLEVTSTYLDVLEELDLLLVGVDRPSYGCSDPHPNR